jgi:nucleoid-associated protein YgaU
MSDRATVARPSTSGPFKSGEAGPSGGPGTLQSTRGLTFTQGREALSPPAPPAGGPNDAAGNGGGGSVVVRRGDTLWGLAEQAYGEGRLWTKIRDANPTRVANGGQVILVNPPRAVPIETPWYEEALDWVGEHSDYLVAAGFAVAGAAIITATLAEDAATFGAGTADDPLSFAAAAQMFGLAVQYAR